MVAHLVVVARYIGMVDYCHVAVSAFVTIHNETLQHVDLPWEDNM